LGRTRLSYLVHGWIRTTGPVFLFLLLTFFGTAKPAAAKNVELPAFQGTHIEYPVVLTQLPARTEAELGGPIANGMLRANYGDGARIAVLYPDLSTKVLSDGFHSACDPDVSFDAKHILFTAKKNATDNWNIFEMGVDGSNVRQITNGDQDHRSPGYQATLYTIVSDKPWYQLTYVGSEKDAVNEYGIGPATSLYSCKLDGSAVRRLTFNLSSDMDPFIMQDGRVLLASWQRSGLDRGLFGRVSLFGINIDGADYAAFCGEQGKRIKHMPCTTTKGLAVFVEAERIPWDGAGALGCVSLRRPLHHYRAITKKEDGLFHSPSGLPDGSILVSRRSADGGDTHGLYRFDPKTGHSEPIFDSPDYHEIQARVIHPREEPDGRSSVVTEKDPNGKLYCLSVNISDMAHLGWSPAGMVKRLRILEGIPLTKDAVGSNGRASGHWHNGIPPLAQRRVLGEIDLNPDGSFNVEVPANVPIELQTLDADGMALRSCSWIWAKNHEPRGCIGCHEDGELTPENELVNAVTRSSIKLTLPPERRRTVDFGRDVMPIIARKCAQCHDKSDAPIRLNSDMSPVSVSDGKSHFNRSYMNLLAVGSKPGQGKYVHPGKARTSPLIWHLFGRNTSRQWDGDACQRKAPKIPADGPVTLTEDEKRTFVEWIDMGALWDGIPRVNKKSEDDDQAGGSQQ